jgi:hypothetical protein
MLFFRHNQRRLARPIFYPAGPCNASVVLKCARSGIGRRKQENAEATETQRAQSKKSNQFLCGLCVSVAFVFNSWLSTVAVLQSIRQDTQRKRLCFPDCFFARLTVRQHPGKLRNFGDPSSIGFLFGLDCVHPLILPRRMADTTHATNRTKEPPVSPMAMRVASC